MRSLGFAFATFAVVSIFSTQAIKSPYGLNDGPAPIQVMVLATYHMSNPGRDAVNIHVDDVLQPKRQRELASLAKELERFRPTKIAVEAKSSAPDFIWKARLDAKDLATNASEANQIGERVAIAGGLDKLYGVDQQGDFDLEPVKALDDRQTGGVRMKSLMGSVKALTDEAEIKQHTLSISDSLAWMNSPEAIKTNNSVYMKALLIADGEYQPSAKLAAQWYERNVRIWSNILQIAKPGDRIIMIYGQGHAYWLKTLVLEMPGYQLVDPLPYLKPMG